MTRDERETDRLGAAAVLLLIVAAMSAGLRLLHAQPWISWLVWLYAAKWMLILAFDLRPADSEPAR